MQKTLGLSILSLVIEVIVLISEFICSTIPSHLLLKTNILGTLNVLGMAKRTKARVLLTSTSEIYGDPLQKVKNWILTLRTLARVKIIIRQN